MTATPAPTLTDAEQQVVDRFGIFEPEEREAAVVESVARAMAETDDPIEWARLSDRRRDSYRSLAVAAVAAYRSALPTVPTCGDLSPSINLGGGSETERLMCELPVGHAGAHEHDNGDGLPPTRWIAAQDGGAEETVRRVEALADRLEDESGYLDPFTARVGVAGRLRAALAAVDES